MENRGKSLLMTWVEKMSLKKAGRILLGILGVALFVFLSAENYLTPLKLLVQPATLLAKISTGSLIFFSLAFLDGQGLDVFDNLRELKGRKKLEKSKEEPVIIRFRIKLVDSELVEADKRDD